ncbi:bifunctional ATP-dependent dihydroxyacetone kinase/FAD-AMP lyase [Phlyctochytrium arcticum]|nr:bifunctional ATP-dependent dihydroxyacetone kinase/FAD-AMP lyase [Phlyctochytrium arcticum]
MHGKKLINKPAAVVDEALEGVLAGNSDLFLLKDHRVIFRKASDNHVAVISGGGSGHEPAHVGFVGDGMLNGAVCGSVFASPSASQVYAAIQRVNTGAGVLVIIKNYTGDRIQFGKAVERARRNGIPVEMVVVADDCAIARTKLGRAGRRGLAGTVLVHKVAGAAARSGMSLKEVHARAQQASDVIGTVGVALGPCTLPGAKEPAFNIGQDEMEFGLGIHGEAGAFRVGTQTAHDAVAKMLDLILSEDTDRGYLTVDANAKEEVALLVNNLGALTGLELSILTKEAVEHLARKSIKVTQIISGALMTALEMPGVSLTLFKNTPDGYLHKALAEEVSASAWPLTNGAGYTDIHERVVCEAKTNVEPPKWPIKTPQGLLIARCLFHVSQNLLKETDKLNAYDRVCGDGDCGSTVESGANAVLAALGAKATGSPEPKLGDVILIPVDNASETFETLSEIVDSSMGGSLGGVVCLFLEALSTAVPSPIHIALTKALAALESHIQTRVGDRTLMDALVPSIGAFNESLSKVTASNPTTQIQAAKSATSAAWTGVDNTVAMNAAKAGRAGSVGTDLSGTPDPGAVAVAVVWESVQLVLEDKANQNIKVAY